MRREHILVGWYTDAQYYRRRVEIEVELADKPMPAPHEGEPSNPEHGLELTISSWSGRARKRDGAFIMERWEGEETGDPLDCAAGQARDEVANVTDFAPGWDAAKRDRLLEVWDRWHLNGMNAACAHQRELGWTYDTHTGQKCPTCGYKIGTAWLYEPLPEDVIAFARELTGEEER